MKLKKYLVIIVGIVVGLALKAYSQDMHCRKIYLDADHTSIYVDELRLSLASTDGWRSGNIDWQTFQIIEKLKESTEKYVRHYSVLTGNQKEIEKQRLKDLFDEDATLSVAIKILSRKSDTSYLPTQYEMRSAFVKEILDVLKLLPVELRPVVAKIPWDKRRLLLDHQTASWMERHREAFEKTLPSIGSKSYLEYERDLRELAKIDEDIAKVLALFDNNQIVAGTNVRESGRFWIPKVGFQNVYVAKTSAGYDLGKEDKRIKVESSGTGISPLEFRMLDAEIKPKYGVLTIDPNFNPQMFLEGPRYGSDFYVFKKQIYPTNLSIYVGDSIRLPSQMKNFDLVNIDSQTIAQPSNWRGMFIPWSYRLLLVPFLTKSLKENKFKAYKPDELSDVQLDWLHLWSDDVFLEVQAFGKLGLDQVEAFVFRITPPSGEFLHELRRHNIKIYDGRNGSISSWMN